MPMPMITRKKTLPGLFEEGGWDVFGFGTREFRSENLILPKDYCVHWKHGIGSAHQRAVMSQACPGCYALDWRGAKPDFVPLCDTLRLVEDDTAAPQ